jgi:FtsP/CotA-like multicopper oxidase with cupredoxin domain
MQQTIRIAQAERYEVVIDFRDSPAEVVLLNLFEEGKLRNVMKFKVLPEAVVDPSSVPNQLMSTEPELRLGGQSLQQRFDELRALGTRVLRGERPPEIARFRSFEFNRDGGQFTINGHNFRASMDLVTQCPSATNVDDADPKEGTVEVWTFKNSSGGWFHPIHTHLLHAGFGYLMLDRNGVPITATSQEWGWKETANLGFGNTIRVIMRWPRVPIDPFPPGLEHCFLSRRYAFHCHNTDHEDDDMMAQVRVDRA